MAVSRRRVSAPVAGSADAGAGICVNQSSNLFVTLRPTLLRTAPSSIAFKIDQFPKGWTVEERPLTAAEEGADGLDEWLPVRPRGFVQLTDVVLVQQTQSLNAEGVKELEAQREALFALREEHLRLSEANLLMAEQEAEKRKSIFNLERLEAKLIHRQELMHMKLKRCQEAIVKAVECVDRIFTPLDKEQYDEEPVRSPVDGEWARIRMRGLQAEARLAGDVVASLIDEEECSEAGHVIEPYVVAETPRGISANLPFCGVENTASAKALSLQALGSIKEDSKFVSQAFVDSSAGRVPLRSLNVALAGNRP